MALRDQPVGHMLADAARRACQEKYFWLIHKEKIITPPKLPGGRRDD